MCVIRRIYLYFFIFIIIVYIIKNFWYNKISSIKKFENLPNGIGLIADDISAGLFAFITLAAIVTGLTNLRLSKIYGIKNVEYN